MKKTNKKARRLSNEELLKSNENIQLSLLFLSVFLFISMFGMLFVSFWGTMVVDLIIVLIWQTYYMYIDKTKSYEEKVRDAKHFVLKKIDRIGQDLLNIFYEDFGKNGVPKKVSKKISELEIVLEETRLALKKDMDIEDYIFFESILRIFIVKANHSLSKYLPYNIRKKRVIKIIDTIIASNRIFVKNRGCIKSRKKIDKILKTFDFF